MPVRTKAVSSSQPTASNNTCAPTDGPHQSRERPARRARQLIQPVCISPVWTRHRAPSVSTSDTTPVQIRLRNRRKISDSWDCVLMGKGCRREGAATMCDNWLESHTKNSYIFNSFSKLIGVITRYANVICYKNNSLLLVNIC